MTDVPLSQSLKNNVKGRAQLFGDEKLEKRLLDVIQSESNKLKGIASLPLPDVVCGTENENDPNDSSCGESHDCSTQNLESSFLELEKEISALSSERSESRWALGMAHILGEKDVRDIRALKPDPTNLLGDPDGDRASLYWYVKSKQSLYPGYDFTSDPTFNALSDRVVFGFSIRSKSEHDCEVTDLAENMLRAVNAGKTIKRLHSNKRKEEAARIIQKFLLRERKEPEKLKTNASKLKIAKATNLLLEGLAEENFIIDKGLQKVLGHNQKGKLDGTWATAANGSEYTKSKNRVKPSSFSLGIERNHTACSDHASPYESGTRYLPMTSTISGRFHTRAMTESNENIKARVVPSKPNLERMDVSFARHKRNKEYEWLLSGLLQKMNGLAENKISDTFTKSSPRLISCKNSRDILAGLLIELEQNCHIYGNTEPPLVLVELVQLYNDSKSLLLTEETFARAVLVLSYVLSEKFVGAEESIINCCITVFRFFSMLKPSEEEGDEGILQRIREFLQEVNVTKAWIVGSYVGRLLEKVGAKEGHGGTKSGLAIVNNFIQSQQSSHTVSQTVFRQWLASLKPKIDASDMHSFLTEVSSGSEVCMTKFIKICFPRYQWPSNKLQLNLKSISSNEWGSTWIAHIIGSCAEHDFDQTGFIEWRVFLKIIDNTPLMLTAGEATQWAKTLSDSSTNTQVRYDGLSHKAT